MPFYGKQKAGSEVGLTTNKENTRPKTHKRESIKWKVQKRGKINIKQNIYPCSVHKYVSNTNIPNHESYGDTKPIITFFSRTY